jgi:hypothetical protein
MTKLLWNNNKSKFNHTIDIVIVAFECMLYNKHSDPSVVKNNGHCIVLYCVRVQCIGKSLHFSDQLTLATKHNTGIPVLCKQYWYTIVIPVLYSSIEPVLLLGNYN